MPVFNVESYINEALDSVLEQASTEIELEIIIVDDGSTDHTKDFIKEYQEKHHNIKLIEQQGIGPGKARNIAIDLSTGDYIAFIDGDDILYPQSYKKMLASARQNDADIVVGNVSRFDSTRDFFLSGLHRKIFSDELVGISILNYSPLLFDTTSWNKLFKGSFLREHDIKFPEGILYEDIPFNMAAHIKSSNTNIILDYVYKWQLRNAVNKSITQSRHDVKNMLDRMTAMRLFRDIIEEEDVQNQELLRAKEMKELTIDLKLYLDQLREADQTYLEHFSDAVTTYINNMQTDVFETELTADIKIKYDLLMAKRYDDLLLFIESTREFNQLKTINETGNVYKDVTGTKFETMLNASRVDVTTSVTPHTKIRKVFWADSEVTIEGFAYLRYLNTSKQTRIEATLVTRDESKSVSLPVKLVKDASTTQIYGGGKKEHLIKRYVNYDYSGYSVKINVSEPKIQELLSEDCFVKLTLINDGHSQEVYVGNPVNGYKTRPKDQVVSDVVYNISYNKMWRFKISSLLIGGFIKELQIHEHELTAIGTKIGFDDYRPILFNYGNDIEIPLEVTSINEDDFHLKIDLEELKSHPHGENYYLMFVKGDETYKVELTADFSTRFSVYDGLELCVSKSRNNRMIMSFNEVIQPKLVDFSLTEMGKSYQLDFKVEQYLTLDERVGDKEVWVEANRNSDGNVVTLRPTRIESGQELNLSTYQVILDERHLALFGNSSWTFTLHLKGPNSLIKRGVITEKIEAESKWKIKKNNFVLVKSRNSIARLNTYLDKSYFDKGPRRLKFLKEHLYPLMRKLPQKKNYVMFESYWGRSYSCNPKAIYEQMLEEYPNMVGIWSFNNPYNDIKGPGKRVKRNSWQYFYYLARSKYFINNVNWPTEYLKRDSSIEVQTLHGTFLKTMGLDVADEVRTEAQLKGFRQRHSRWDYLVSPSSFMTTIAKRVFEFNGEMLEYGFPRNDLLVNRKENNTFTKELKQKLNIPEDKKVILYAPTYRNKKGFNLELDIKEMKESLSDDYVLLVRLHYFVAKSIDLTGVEDFVINVCNYPDVQELLLLTDVLITDYSSIMFDFANLKKPMLFFTYDLEYYKDVLRGMYLDFEVEAPGKLCKKTDELIECLKDLDTYEKTYQESMQRFEDKFNEFETGKASSEILNKIFE